MEESAQRQFLLRKDTWNTKRSPIYHFREEAMSSQACAEKLFWCLEVLRHIDPKLLQKGQSLNMWCFGCKGSPMTFSACFLALEKKRSSKECRFCTKSFCGDPAICRILCGAYCKNCFWQCWLHSSCLDMVVSGSSETECLSRQGPVW